MRPTAMWVRRMLVLPVTLSLAAGCQLAPRAVSSQRSASASASVATPAASVPAAARTGVPGTPPPLDPWQQTFPGEVYSAKAAATRAGRLLTFLDLPATAVALKGTPPRQLAPAPKSVPPRNLLVRSRWLTARGSTKDLVAFFTNTAAQDPPPRHPGPGVTRVTYQPWTGHLTIVVTILAEPRGIALRVDGEDVWLAHRSALENIPFGISVVELTTTSARHPAKNRHAVVRSYDVFKLGLDLDGDLPRAPGPCPVGHPDVRTRATYRLGHRVVTFSWADAGCDIIKVEVNGKPETSLAGRLFAGQMADYLLTGKT